MSGKAKRAPEEIHLPGGYKIKREEGMITVGSVSITGLKTVTDTDIHFVKSVFAMGMAAKATNVARIFNMLIEEINNPVDIMEGVEL